MQPPPIEPRDELHTEGVHADAPDTEAPVTDDHPAPGGIRSRLGTAVTNRVERVRTAPLSTWLTAGVSFLVVAVSVLFTLAHLHPGLIVANNTPAGGDMGAHVWAPAYLRDHLLPNLRLTGWTPDWYAGFPALQFYMVPPMLLIVLFDVVLPYGVAFKLVAVSGILTLPIAAWLFGRLAGLGFPGPQLLAVGAVGFLFDRTYSILGGNIPSTLAGEFAFSISLSLAVVYLGLVANGLQTGRYRALAAVVVGLCGLTHVIPLFFAIAGTFVLLALYPSIAGLRWVATTGPVGALLAMWWLLPFYAQRSFMNDMGWEKKLPEPGIGVMEEIGFWTSRLFPTDTRFVAYLAVVGLAFALARRSIPALFLIAMLVIGCIGFVVVPQGRLWNERLLPFVHLCTYLIAAYGVAEWIRSITRRTADADRSLMAGAAAVVAAGLIRVALRTRFAPDGESWNEFAVPVINLVVMLALVYGFGQLLRWALASTTLDTRNMVRSGAAVLAAVIGLGIVAFPLRSLPLGGEQADGSYSWPVSPLSGDALRFGFNSNDSSYIPGWAEWNFRGYEGKAAWPEFEDVVLTMGNVGERNGCGRAMWEYERGLDRYGTPMAMMLMPMWTDGCIGSMEGLYFESSTTTPYHFLNQSALSESPSRAQREMPYGNFDIDLGVRQLQLMGVRYYMALSDLAIQSASAHPDLDEVARSGPWVIYEVGDAPLVEPLENEPIVRPDVHDAPHEWIPETAPWFQSPGQWELFWASDGPEGWQRTEDPASAERRAQPMVEVSNIESGNDWLRFEVSEPGTPILVKISYFPNWRATGADGPWRVTPNLMVVIPTDTSVELHYGRSAVEFAGWGLTFIGMGLVVLLARLGPLVMPAWSRERDLIDPDDDALRAAGINPTARMTGRSRPRVLDEPTNRPPPPGDLRLSVVVPAYNEGGVIAGTIAEISRVLGDLDGGMELVVVDDGSSDDTATAAAEAGAQQVISLPTNSGKGAAVRAGALAANGRTVVFTDADLAYAPDQILPLLTNIEAGWDIVVGSRHVAGSSAEVPASLLRRVGGRVINLLVRLVLNGDHADTQCGLKAFRRDVAQLLFGDTRVDGFAFDVELFALAERHRLSLLASPVRVVNSTSSSVRLTQDTAVLVLDLLRISWRLRRGGYAEPDQDDLPAPGIGVDGS